MTEQIIEFDEDELYEGPPDSVDRGDPNDQDDDATALRTFAGSTQRDVAGALAWYTREAPSPPFDPDGMCLKVCRTARNIGAAYSSALKAQNATPAKHRIIRVRDIKPGHVMYFDTVGDSNPYGHIVTVVGRVAGVDVDSLSSLVVWTNSVKRNQLVKVRADYFPRYWNDRFTFAADWLNGVALIMPKAIIQPAPVTKTPKGYMSLKVAQASLQFSDSTRQRQADVDKIFAQGYHWITGTEGGEASTRALLRSACTKFKHQYRLHVVRDTWVAVRSDLIDGGWTTGSRKFIDTDLVAGPGHHTGIAYVSFVNSRIGRVTIGSSHYPKESDSKNSPDRRSNVKWAKVVANNIDKWADEFAVNKGLVFYGGDQNIDDKKSDTFVGVTDLVSCWDDLKKYPGTHGSRTIDVIARNKKNTRVKPCVAANSRVDKEFFLNSDHALAVARYHVKEI